MSDKSGLIQVMGNQGERRRHPREKQSVDREETGKGSAMLRWKCNVAMLEDL